MADISVTATSVVAGSDANTVAGTIGEAFTAGQMVYKSSATHKFMLADADSATVEARTPDGMALNGGALNQPCVVQKSGDVTLNAVLTAGVAYYLSGTAGGICPVADVGSGEYSCVLGIAKSTTVLDLNIQPSGVAL